MKHSNGNQNRKKKDMTKSTNGWQLWNAETHSTTEKKTNNIRQALQFYTGI